METGSALYSDGALNERGMMDTCEHSGRGRKTYNKDVT